MVDDTEGKPDLVFMWLNDALTENEMYYRVAWNVDGNGNVCGTCWSAVKWTPGKGWFSSSATIGTTSEGAGMAIADLNNNGYLELVFTYMNAPFGANEAKYRIEWEGRVDSHPEF